MKYAIPLKKKRFQLRSHIIVTILDKLRIKGSWVELKGRAKQEWANLTDDDLLYTEGEVDELLGRIQQKTGKTKEEIRSWFDRVINQI